jgi:hypothetical protein
MDALRLAGKKRRKTCCRQRYRLQHDMAKYLRLPATRGLAFLALAPQQAGLTAGARPAKRSGSNAGPLSFTHASSADRSMSELCTPTPQHLAQESTLSYQFHEFRQASSQLAGNFRFLPMVAAA